MLQQYRSYNPYSQQMTAPRQQISYQPYLQTPSFAQQHFTPQQRPQSQFQFNSQPEFTNSIPIAKSIQYEVPKQTKDNNNQPKIDKKYSSKMVGLIKESQELKKQIIDKEKEIQTSKTNIQRLNQLIEYLEKQQNE